MGWDPALVPDPQDPATFTRSKLNWDEAGEGAHARLLELYRSLTALRKSLPDLVAPGFEETLVEFSEEDRWLRLERGAVHVVFNFSTGDCRLNTEAETIRLRTDDAVRLESGKLELPGHSAAILI